MLIEPFTLIDMIDELCFLRDCDILYGLRGSFAHTFHSCHCLDENGQCMFDTGALHKNYISHKFFVKLGLPLQTADSQREARLPNGQTMKVYGTSVIPLCLSEWRGDVECSVIDLNTDFDIILGLPWHKENRPAIDWDTMIYKVEQNGKMRKIFPSSDSKFVDAAQASLNLIDTRRAKKTLKKKGVEFALYYYRNVPAKEDETDIFAPIVENDAASPERKQLSELSDGGKNLWGSVVQRYLARIKTIHKGTSPYHPRTNGKVEALNGLIGSMLTKLLLGKSTKLWDLYLDQALFACRVRTHSTTKTSPFYLVYGKHPRLLGDQNIALQRTMKHVFKQ